jgi:Protein of unknown function (DUF2505)
MSHSIDVSFDSPATVDQVHSAFGTQDYWLARLDHFGGAKKLDSLVVDSDGTVMVTVTEDLRQGGLPRMLATLYRGDLNIMSTEKWRTGSDSRLNGEISVAVTGAPGSGHGMAVLTPSEDGSRLNLSATVEFNVPLVGGKIERYVAGQFADGFAEIHGFTTNWISEHA